jgi:selenide, water dikinase
LVGIETSDDAGVVRLDADRATVHTVDLITPVVDDPFLYGQIAAANSISDIYAMGATPHSALNVCCFPESGPAPQALTRLLEGGLDKINEAGAALVGGHTVRDPELKYGLSVQGLVHPDRILRNFTVHAGDALILTKPLGTGLLMTAHRKGDLLDGSFEKCTSTMARLNKEAALAMQEVGAHAATDVTGFGFLGHLFEMLKPRKMGVRIDLNQLPLYDESMQAAKAYGLSGAIRNNLQQPLTYFQAQDLPKHWLSLLGDPQTSGGLLISLEASRADALMQRLHDLGECAQRVGEVLSEGDESHFIL